MCVCMCVVGNTCGNLYINPANSGCHSALADGWCCRRELMEFLIKRIYWTAETAMSWMLNADIYHRQCKTYENTSDILTDVELFKLPRVEIKTLDRCCVCWRWKMWEDWAFPYAFVTVKKKKKVVDKILRWRTSWSTSKYRGLDAVWRCRDELQLHSWSEASLRLRFSTFYVSYRSRKSWFVALIPKKNHNLNSF